MTPYVDLGARPEPYALAMWVLFALFVARVVGQILAATTRPEWLPPMPRWYSGVMPYRYLLPSQILIIALMIAMVVGVSNAAGSLGVPQRDIGAFAVWPALVYAGGMVWRAIHRAMQPPEKRGVVIPIVFHFVLAAFLFVYGSWHVRTGQPQKQRQGQRQPERQINSFETDRTDQQLESVDDGGTPRADHRYLISRMTAKENL